MSGPDVEHYGGQEEEDDMEGISIAEQRKRKEELDEAERRIDNQTSKLVGRKDKKLPLDNDIQQAIGRKIEECEKAMDILLDSETPGQFRGRWKGFEQTLRESFGEVSMLRELKQHRKRNRENMAAMENKKERPV